MLLSPLAIAAAGLTAAAAFLLPPELLHADVTVKEANSRPFGLAQFAEIQTVELDCPGCPLLLRGHGGRLVDMASHLEMTFTIEHLPTHDRLLLNGFELYPHADPLRSTLVAKQLPDFSHEETGPRMPIAPKVLDITITKLGFGLQWQPVAEDAGSGMQLLFLDFQVIEVGNYFVNGIPNIRLKLLKSPDGALMIGSIDMTESQTGEANTSEPQKECTTLHCMWKDMIAEYWGEKTHDCMLERLFGSNKHAHDAEDRQGKPLPGLELHQHSWKTLLRNLASHVLLPMLIGIAAGVALGL